jgi:hypothetical protein
VIVVLASTAVFIVIVIELVTVYPLITMVISSDWPALTLLSKAEVRHTKSEVDDI